MAFFIFDIRHFIKIDANVWNKIENNMIADQKDKKIFKQYDYFNSFLFFLVGFFNIFYLILHIRY